MQREEYRFLIYPSAFPAFVDMLFSFATNTVLKSFHLKHICMKQNLSLTESNCSVKTTHNSPELSSYSCLHAISLSIRTNPNSTSEKMPFCKGCETRQTKNNKRWQYLMRAACVFALETLRLLLRMYSCSSLWS